MDTRSALKANEHLAFPGLECVIDAAAGRGASVLAYTGYYPDRQDPRIRHRVLIRELFPYDPAGGIIRSGSGDLLIENASRVLFARHRESFLRANEIHSRMADRIPGDIDLHINTYAYHNTLYSVMGYTGGRTLAQEIENLYADSPEDASQMLLRLIRIERGALQVLESFHQAGYLHLDLSPDNILLIGDGGRGRVTLIDYGSVHTFAELQEPVPVSLSMKDGYTAPEVRLGQLSCVGPHTDLFSMTAVFWHCLSGRRLSELEQVGSVKPDPSSILQWRDCPSTVLSMLRQILGKGLSPSPRRRYQSTAEMLADLAELKERVIGRGITHWALWESGRARFLRFMQENISLQFIRDDSRIYPLRVEREDGSRAELPDLPALSENPYVLLLLGGGGMGKTTALFRLAWQECKRTKEYREEAAAVFYISLYGYRDGGEHFLKDTLLEGLRFKPETGTLENARRELLQLLQKAGADRPLVYLLLDGFNEASGDTGPLWEEICLLASAQGVRILMTSRSDPGFEQMQKKSSGGAWNSGFAGEKNRPQSQGEPPGRENPLRRLTLCRLEPADIRRLLAQEGILPPENLEIFDLLGFPILLSIYVQAVKGGETGPAGLQSREQLLDAYFSVLRKNRAAAAKDSDAAGVDAVFRFLLPEIAACIQKQGRAVTDARLMTAVEKCYRELSGSALTAVFPQWIGHTSRLKLGTENADEWYGRAVLDILHQKTGILIRDEQGRLRVLHQIMEEYLVEKSRQFHLLFDWEKRRRKMTLGFALAVSVFLLLSLFGIYNYRMRREIEQKQRQMVLSETEMRILDAVRNSEEALSAGKRREAVDYALEAVLLSCADYRQAETVLTEEDGYDLLRDDLPVIRERLSADMEQYGSSDPADSAGFSGRDELSAQGDPSDRETRSVIERFFYGQSARTQEEAPDSYYTSQARYALTEALGVYDMADGYRPEMVLYLPSHLSGLRLSPGGTRVCAVCAWNLAVYDTVTGEELASFPVPDSTCTDVLFADEDTFLYADPEKIHAYDLVTGTLLWEKTAADGSTVFSGLQQDPAENEQTGLEGLREGFDYFETALDTCVRGYKDSDTVEVLIKHPRQGTEVFSYDPSYPHTETKVSADRRTVTLVSTRGIRIYAADRGEILGEQRLPDPESVCSLNFLRDEEKSLLEIKWTDGTVRLYDASDGKLLSRRKKGPPDPSAPREFITDKYRLMASPRKGIVIYDRDTGEISGEFDIDANVSFVSQTGEYLLIGYTAPKDGPPFAILFNEYFETLARLPWLCDELDGELYFDCPDGSLRKTSVFSLSELLDLAVQDLEGF